MRRMAQLTSTSGVKGIFLLLLVIGFFSMLLQTVTYHIGINLPYTPEDPRELNSDYPQNRIVRNINSDEDISFISQQHKGSYSQQHVSAATQQLNILSKIYKLEEEILSLSRYPALIQKQGGKDNSSGILEELLRHLDYTVVISQNENKLRSFKNFSVIWNLKGHNSSTPILKDLQKTNKIEKLQKVIWQPSFLCSVQKTQSVFSKLQVRDRTLCSTSPQFHQQKTDLPVKREQEFVYLHQDGKITVHKQQLKDKQRETAGVQWIVTPGVLAVDGTPLSVRLSLLLTSLSPLRAYLHSSCQVFNIDQSGRTLREDLTSLWHLRQSIQQNFEETTMRGWWGQLRSGLMSALLTAELQVWKSAQEENPCSCRRCFQHVFVDVIFTNEFQPIVVKMEPSDFIQIPRDIMEDVIKLTSSKDSVVDDILSFAGNIQPQKMHCKSGLSPCLQDSDLIYILDTRREALAPVEFLQLYPSSSGEYSQLMDHFLHLYFTDHRDTYNVTTPPPKCHLTPEVHFMIEEMSQGGPLVEASLHNKPVFMSRKLDAEIPEDITTSKGENPTSENLAERNCTVDEQELPLLSGLSISPTSIKLTPGFDPHHTMYKALVDYSTIVFSISSFTPHCNTIARFHSLDGEESFMNYTLGLGENQIRVHVVLMSGPVPRILNTYIILIGRQERGIPQFRASLRVCQLTQDCELPYSTTEPCGLHAVTQFRSWRVFLKHNSQLPVCQQPDYQQASWLVPCEDCRNLDSCHWRSAIWQPRSCQTKQLSDLDIRKCFKGRKVLFIGDSTNRGIMHYILQKINGSLSEWDKAHNLKLYKSINSNHTDLSFSYYPQFWLPANHRPAFDKAVFQLIKWTQPLTDDNKTALVVGGVHWLARQHLDLIIKALHRENLTHIKLIAKGLGSGFHQYVNGVHHLPQSDIHKLVIREQELEKHGRKLGFEFIKTFNMTMARFKDFLQGKCACHFHKLSEVKSPSLGRAVYQVEGDINEIYSQMVINSICRE
ncbi:cadherin-like and PC-esterase domain-containing protein 1 [Crassostrea virginica]